VVTPVSSNTAVELCDSFKKVMRTRIGSPYVIAGMETAGVDADTQHNQVVVGYEANGGFLLGSDVVCDGRRLTALPTRDAVLPMLALLCMARSQGTALSQLSQRLPARYTASDRLQNVTNALSSALLNRLSNDLTQASQLLAPNSGDVIHVNTVDGLRLIFVNGDIVHLRPSGNAPELRCYAEAGTALQAQRLCDGALSQLRT
jgi:phosphomannomutase